MLSISRSIIKAVTPFARIVPKLAATQSHSFTTSVLRFSTTDEEKATAQELKRLKNDRSEVIPYETSMKYLKSAAYKETYGEKLVWEEYRRNHKGLYPPKKTRKTCIRNGVVSTGNPCPICRDEYLILDYRNVELLQQFICPHTKKILSYSKTGLCQKKHLELMVAIHKAMDYGYIVHEVPFREFDYRLYYGDKYKPEDIKITINDFVD